MNQLIISIIIFVITVILFFSGKFSLGLIGLCAAVALQLTGVLDAATVWNNFTNESVVMFVSLFVLSAGLMKTRLISNFVEKLAKLQGNERKVLWGCLIITMLLAVFMNATAAVATMLPMITLICERSEVNPKKVIKPCCDMANLWVGALPLGVGASTYLTTNLTIQQMGGTQEMGILDTMILKLPVLIAVSVYYFLFVRKFLPNDLPLAMRAEMSGSSNKHGEVQLSPAKENIAYFLFFGTVACMVAGSLLGWPISTFMYPVIGGILMVLTGVLTAQEATKSIPLEMVFLIGGMLSVANALGSTGGATLIGDAVSKVLGGTTNSYIVLAVLFAVPAIMTQFMNNIPVAQAFTPIAIATCFTVGVDHRLGATAVGFAATASIMTPMAAVAQSMAMGPGEYKLIDYLKCSTIPMLIYFVVLLIWAPLAAKLLWGV